MVLNDQSRQAVISSAEVRQLLAQGMGASLHWFPADVAATRLATVLAGMANSAGGIVLIGVSPRAAVDGAARVLGVRDLDEVMDCVFQAALLTDPPLVLPLPRVCMLEQVRVLCVVVPAGLSHVYSLDGRYLGRDGAQTSPLSARRLRQLLLERGAVQFETQIPPWLPWLIWICRKRLLMCRR